MTSRLLIAGVGAACVTAAGLGGYMAVRTATHSSEAASLTSERTVPAIPDAVTPSAAPVAPSSLEPASPAPVARPTTSSVRATPPRPVTATPAPAGETPEVVEVVPAPAPAAPIPVLSVPTSESAALPMHPGRNIDLPGPRYELFELPATAVIGIRIDTTVSSDSARVEDPVQARVTRPVIIDGVTVIPTGARLSGMVTVVEPGGRFRERARIGVRFTSVTIDDRRHVPIQTEAIYREGDAPTGEATAKIGASAVVGSILGGVLGGRKGAAIGAATGAAGGTAIVAAGGPNEATLPSGSTITLRLTEPATFQIDR